MKKKIVIVLSFLLVFCGISHAQVYRTKYYGNDPKYKHNRKAKKSLSQLRGQQSEKVIHGDKRIATTRKISSKKPRIGKYYITRTSDGKVFFARSFCLKNSGNLWVDIDGNTSTMIMQSQIGKVIDLEWDKDVTAFALCKNTSK